MLRREFKYSLKRFAPVILMVLFLLYIYYHTISGDRGLATWYTLSNQVGVLEAENVELAKNIARLEKEVGRLSVETPDRDYLDELTRRTLPVLAPNEKVIFVPEGQ